MDILNIAAGITLGGVFTGMFWLCLRAADKSETWADVDPWTVIGFIVPLGFVALMLFLEGPERFGL